MNPEDRKRVPEGGWFWRKVGTSNPAWYVYPPINLGADENSTETQVKDESHARQIVGSVNTCICRDLFDEDEGDAVQLMKDTNFWNEYRKGKP